MLTKEFINPHAMGFTNTVTYTHGGVKTIVISGQVGFADGKVGETFEEQADIAHQNIIRELAAAGASAEDLIKINTYVVDLDSTRSKAVQAAKAKYFTQEHQPASTMVGVSALVMKPLLVEIEATAVVEA